jgi:tetratricopeptide (TPR) repeat protein
MIRVRATFVVVVALLVAATATASWYDDYDAGIKAIRGGNWATAIAKMTAAINAKPNENDKERTYGAIFINYHPYYYRAVAELNAGRYQAALDDIEKTSGPGEIDLGSIETLVQRIKNKMDTSTPAPPTPTPPAPVPPTPAPPSMDAALRRRATAAVNEARQKLNEARGRNAGSSQYTSALNAFTALNSRNSAAQTNDDLNRVINDADNVGLLADAVIAPVPVPPTPVPPTPVPPTPVPPIKKPKPDDGTGLVLGEAQRRVRSALESYFNGDFDEATSALQRLSQDMPTNGWIWAFLGASQYSQYAFEADTAYRDAALESFRRAKSLRSWKGGLPQKYFSRRIRRVFDTSS